LLLSGLDVVDTIVSKVCSDVPVLVHSMNVSQAPKMVSKLERAGFLVTRIPMDELSKERLRIWLNEVREIWEDQLEG
jgi:hypothetical protein